MPRKPDAGKLMYDRAINDYGKEFIDKLFKLCKNVRRDAGLKKSEKQWTINGLLRYLGNKIEDEYNETYP